MRKTNNNALERNAAPVNIIHVQCARACSARPVPDPVSVRGGVWQTTSNMRKSGNGRGFKKSRSTVENRCSQAVKREFNVGSSGQGRF